MKKSGGQPGPRTLRASQRPGQEPWEQEWNGHTWQDMPTRGGSEHKLLDFALYRRGLYDPELDLAVDEEDEEGDEVVKPKRRSRSQRRFGCMSFYHRPSTRERAPRASADKESDKALRAARQAELLARYQAARSQRGFVVGVIKVDQTAHSAIARALGMGRACVGPLRTVSLDRIEAAFEKMRKEGWTV